MVIWSGLGILVILIPVLTALVMQSVTEALLGPGAYRQNPWLTSLGLLASALAVWLLGRRLNGRSARVLVDQATGEQVTLRPRHSLFFVRMEYWAVVVTFAAVYLAVRPI